MLQVQKRFAILLALLFALVLTAGCASSPKQEANLPEEAKAFVEDFVAALNTGKPDKIMTYYHKDFVTDGRDWQATKEIYDQYAAMTAGSWSVNVTDVKIDGNLALIDGTIANQFTEASLKGNYLIKEDGQWKMYGNRKE